MMSKEEIEIVKLVYSRLIDSEVEAWTEIDDILEPLGYLSDSELLAEAEVAYRKFSNSEVLRCEMDHDQIYCVAPLIYESVGAILDLDAEFLHIKNAYILKYFLGMLELKMIFTSSASWAI